MEKNSVVSFVPYRITERGNFEGKNIPNLIQESIYSYAIRNEMDVEELSEKLEEVRKQLFTVREKRVHPYKDENFNGLEWFDDCCSCKSWEDFRQLRVYIGRGTCHFVY